MSAVATFAADSTLLKRLLCPLSNFRLLTSTIAQSKDDRESASASACDSPVGSGSDEENDPNATATETATTSATPPRLTMVAASPPPPPHAQTTPPHHAGAAAGVSPRAPSAISPTPRRRTRSCLATASSSSSSSSSDGSRARRARTVSFVSDEDERCKEVLGTAIAGVDRTSIATTAVESFEWEQLGGDWQKPDTAQLRQANAAWQVSQPLIAPADAGRDTRYGCSGLASLPVPVGLGAAGGAPPAGAEGPHDFLHVQWAMYVLMPERGGWVPCTAVRYSPARRRVWIAEGGDAVAACAKQSGAASAAPAPGDAGVLLQSSTCRLMECHEESTISTFERLQLQIFEEVNGEANSATAAAAEAEEERSCLVSSKRRSLTYPPPDGSSRTEEAARLAIKRARMLEIEARGGGAHRDSLQEAPSCLLGAARLRFDVQRAAGGASFMG